jgi:NitT/TauT family transport system ATP-binding protein
VTLDLQAAPVAPPRAAAPPVIEARRLSLVFQTRDGPVHALSAVDLAIAPGEFVSLIGPSGCGKTTLLRAIADLERPSSGELRVGGVPRAERRERARRWLGVVGLAGFERKHPWQLSGGMQQRVSIARALSFDPALLLMDEPFGALDEITRDHLNDQLHGLWRRTGKTVVFVTHSIAEAVYLSTRIVVMSPRPGRILEVIESPLPPDRVLDMRESAEFARVAQRVREGLKAGHSYED